MIVFHDRQLLILTPPHTASRAMHETLGLIGGIWREAPNPDGLIDHHTAHCPADWAHYRRVVVVRNPFARAVGLWYHLAEWNALHGDGVCSFHDYLQLVAADDPAKLSWMYRFTIRRWLGDTRPDVVLRYETLAADLDELLGLRPSWPPRPAKWRRSWQDYYTPTTRTLVERWAAADFVAFNYGWPPG